MPSRRDLIRLTDDEIASFLAGRQTMNVATYNHDGSIHLVAMWYGQLEGCYGFHTFAKSQKIQNLRRDPRITALVEGGEAYDELRGVELVGRAELVEDPDRLLVLVSDVVSRYWPVDDPAEIPAIAEGVARKRVGVKIHVERLVSWDHAKLATLDRPGSP